MPRLDFVLRARGSHQRCVSEGGAGTVSLAEQGRLVGRKLRDKAGRSDIGQGCER